MVGRDGRLASLLVLAVLVLREDADEWPFAALVLLGRLVDVYRINFLI